MKTLATFILCAFSGAFLAVMGPFSLKLFHEYMAVIEKGVQLDLAAVVLFLIIGVFLSAAFIAGHCFSTLNKRVAKKVEEHFAFLD